MPCRRSPTPPVPFVLGFPFLLAGSLGAASLAYFPRSAARNKPVFTNMAAPPLHWRTGLGNLHGGIPLATLKRRHCPKVTRDWILRRELLNRGLVHRIHSFNKRKKEKRLRRRLAGILHCKQLGHLQLHKTEENYTAAIKSSNQGSSFS